METTDSFPIRAYSKKELALLYFPDSMPDTAVRHLMSWIRSYSWLCDALLAMGYKTTSKTFTPRQVRTIVDELGPPGN